MNFNADNEPTTKDSDMHRLWLGVGLALMVFVGWQYHSTKAAKAEAHAAILAECNAEQDCMTAVANYFEPCFDANYTSGLSVVLNDGGMLECLSSKGGVQIAIRD